MSRSERVALVTGANRGIGLEVCRQLARRGLRVVLTARDTPLGQAAAAHLSHEGLEVVFHPLDVAEAESVTTLRLWVEEHLGGLDVLVNNAAVYLDEGVSIFDVTLPDFATTLETNLYGPLHLCRAFVPGMRDRGYGRVVNVSSVSGQLSTMGGYTGAYAISKAALNALTRVVAAEAGPRVKVNAACPGWVRTGMGGPSAPRTVAQGADGIVWLATLPDSGPTGGFFRDGRPIDW